MNRIFSNYKFIGKVILVLGVLAVVFTTPLAAAENPKIKLPDGVYMYDSSVQRQKDGTDRVGFGKFFVVHNKNIYSSKDFVKKFGILKLNTLFGGNKKYKILLNGEVIGEKYNLRFKKDEAIDRENAVFFCNESYIARNLKEGPAYGRESIYLGRLGSAVKFLAVPEQYKEVKKKVYTTLPQEEVDKIARLIQDKLFDLVKNRKEITQNKACHIKKQALAKHNMELLDKISDRNSVLYIGMNSLVLKTVEEGTCTFEIVFSVRNGNLHIVTSQYDHESLDYSMMAIQGILDFDGDGEDELIIEKVYDHEDEAITNLEIYKQKSDVNWTMIKKISWRVEL